MTEQNANSQLSKINGVAGKQKSDDGPCQAPASLPSKGPLETKGVSASPIARGVNLRSCTAGTEADSWWREWEIGVLVLLVAAIYLSRLNTISLRGEESRRAGIAIEMMRSGDWIVPRLQARPVFFRPPLQNWAIAVVGLWRGRVDMTAIRTPTFVALLLTALLIYLYSRSFLSRLGAMSAAVAFITMGEIMQTGRLGETEMMLTLFISSSLLIWHYGRLRGWPALWNWSAGYFLAALAVLTKGPQGIVYFAGPVWVYLLLTRRGRELWRWSHLTGLLVFLGVLGAWQVPYCLAEGWAGVRGMYWQEVAIRFTASQSATICKHLLTYPIEVLGCMLPWSALLLAYLSPKFRATLGAVRQQLWFLLCCLAVTFPTCWFACSARTRYFMPLYPCFAVLIGLVVQRCSEAGRDRTWAGLWSWYLAVAAVLMPVAGVFIAGATLVGDASFPLGQPVWFAVVYLLAAAVLGVATWRSRVSITVAQARIGVLSMAIFLGLTSTGVRTNVLTRTREPTAEAVADLRQQLGPDARLVSLGPIHHLFTYYYGDPIPMLPYPIPRGEIPAVGEYFCFSNRDPAVVEVPFPWQKVTEISCERRHKAHPHMAVTVGCRLPDGR
jgi:4-amino-4-deoxy-L-arabinose transferase-like glycosyltransferase